MNVVLFGMIGEKLVARDDLTLPDDTTRLPGIHRRERSYFWADSQNQLAVRVEEFISKYPDLDTVVAAKTTVRPNRDGRGVSFDVSLPLVRTIKRVEPSELCCVESAPFPTQDDLDEIRDRLQALEERLSSPTDEKAVALVALLVEDVNDIRKRLQILEENQRIPRDNG